MKKNLQMNKQKKMKINKPIKATKKDIINRLAKANNITITGHRHPDVDCIGSCIVLSVILKTFFKKKCVVINTDSMQKELKNLFFIDKVLFDVNEKNIPPKDVLVVLDSGDMNRIGYIADIANEYNEVIFIDHHKVRDLKYVTMLYNDTKSSATAEIISDIFSKYIEKIDYKTATILYCALCTDTGSFVFSNTTEKTLKTAAKLITRKVDLLTVGRIVKKRYDRTDIKALTEIYKKIVVDEKNNVGYICVGETLAGQKLSDINVSPAETLMQVDNVLIGFIIRENKKSFRVSLRSRCKKDIRGIAEKFGGGGHKKASGFEVSKENYTKEKLIKNIHEEILKLLDEK